MKKNIMIINADREAAQIVKDNLACPSTNILCVSSIYNAEERKCITINYSWTNSAS